MKRLVLLALTRVATIASALQNSIKDQAAMDKLISFTLTKRGDCWLVKDRRTGNFLLQNQYQRPM